MVEVEEGNLTPLGFVDGLELAYVNPNINNKHVYKSPFLPLECLAQTTIGAANSKTTKITENGQTTYLLHQSRTIPNVYLQLMIVYEFDELDREGFPNKDIQLLTYPIQFNDEHGGNLVDQLSTVQTNVTLNTKNFTQNNTIQAFNTVTINGSLTTNNGINVTIRAQEIILGNGANIGEGITLETGTPSICGAKIPNFQGNMTTYCSQGGYLADILKRKTAKPESTIITPKPTNKEIKLALAPNPTSSITELFIDDVENNKTVMVQVVNMMGQIVLKKQVISNGEMFKVNLDLSAYPAGTYSVICNSDNGQTKTIRLVKI